MIDPQDFIIDKPRDVSMNDESTASIFSDSIHSAFQDLCKHANFAPHHEATLCRDAASSTASSSTSLSTVQIEIIPQKSDQDNFDIDVFFSKSTKEESREREPVPLKCQSRRIGKKTPAKPAKKATESIKKVIRLFRKEYLKDKASYSAKHVEEYFT